MVSLETVVLGKKFSNPLILPSGPFGNGKEFSEYFDLSKIGGFTSKTVTPLPKDGNPPPRIVNINGGILNSIGLQNPGIEWFVKNDMKFLKSIPTNLIVSIGGYDTNDFTRSIKLVDCKEIAFFELNLSCPNVDGEILGENKDKIFEIVKAVKSITEKPVFVKLGFNNKIEELAEAAVKGNADGITVINSPNGAKIDVKTGRIILKRGTGGVSGPLIKPLAISMIYRIRKNFKEIAIIGTGGVATSEDALEFLMAGADLVGVGMATMVDFEAPLRILKGIKEFLKEKKLDIKQIVSISHRGGL